MAQCPQCGKETEPEAAFCSACGTPLGEKAPPPPSPPPAGKRPRWPLIGGAVIAVALALGGVALYDAAANDGDWADSLFGGGGEEEAAVAAPSPTPEATVRLFPTVEPRPSPVPSPAPSPEPTAPEEPTVAPPTPGYATPEEAIGAFLAESGLAYVGDCEGASLETDIGSYCSMLWEDRVDTRIYIAGPTFSEASTWLLLAPLGGGDDWTVVDAADYEPGPEEPVPPWP